MSNSDKENTLILSGAVTMMLVFMTYCIPSIVYTLKVLIDMKKKVKV